MALEENISLLGDAIGLELTVEAVEKPIGIFKADIVCRADAQGTIVLIENQLTRTDHTHLGQLITYAAGLEAVTIVWIAHRFADEHRAALDWLNRVTSESVHFFGVEIELWTIGDSLPAPRMNVVSLPNDWQKTIKTSLESSLTAGQQQQIAYWSAFREYALDSGNGLKFPNPYHQSWMSFGIGRSGIQLNAVAAKGDPVGLFAHDNIRVEILTMSTTLAQSFFEQLSAQKEQIEAELGFPLSWYQPNEGERVPRLRRPGLESR